MGLNLGTGVQMHAINSAKKRRPLPDVKPKAKFAHQESTIVLGYRDPVRLEELRDSSFRFELLSKTIRSTIAKGGLSNLWSINGAAKSSPSVLLNLLIEQATAEALPLIRRPMTPAECMNGCDFGFSDYEVIRQATNIATKHVRAQKVITRPYKINDGGSLILRDGRPVQGYEAMFRIVYPVQLTDDGKKIQEWDDPTAKCASGFDGKALPLSPKGDAEDVLIDAFMRAMLRDLLADYVGQEDAGWLLEYLDSKGNRRPFTDQERQRASRLITRLAEHETELRRFACLLT
jgi:hypothetical protein